jgi:hypothetical protein
MNINELPSGKTKPALDFLHFPDKMHAFVFRNWNMMSPGKMAEITGTISRNIVDMAQRMGLPAFNPQYTKNWKEHGYISLLRQNWHLLPYSQLLQLLDISASELAFRLKEDDFLFYKLGSLKPETKPLKYSEPNEAILNAEKRIAEIISTEFDSTFLMKSFKPFEFKPCAKAFTEKSENLRMLYPYSAGYGDPFLDNELKDFPEEMFEAYRDAGINGLWMQALLYNLVPWSHVPEMSGDYRRRRRNINKLTERAAKYGIGIYFYFNEPRTIPKKYADKFIELKGIETDDAIGLCTSKKPILDYIEHSMKELFAVCQGLAGIFVITRSENTTNCASHARKDECPLCAKRSKDEIISELINAMAKGISSSKTEARVMAYTWAWEKDYINNLIAKLAPNVSVLSVSEWGIQTDCEGYKSKVVDYSISHPGPSERAMANWHKADKCNLSKVAKIQINNSWELSAVPYIPVFDIIERHLDKLHSLGVNDFMLCWTLGGQPTPMFGLLDKRKEKLLKELYGDEAFSEISEAVKCFSDAFEHFPFDQTAAIYNAPQNYGPMNLIYEQPTGYDATMLGFPYDDLDAWRSIYPADVFLRAFKHITTGWENGLKLLDKAISKIPNCLMKNFDELKRYAAASYCHFKSTENQICFIIMRSEEQLSEEIVALLQNEIELCKCLATLQGQDSKIGFEASNHYYYTPNLLMEKVLNCRDIISRYLSNSC